METAAEKAPQKSAKKPRKAAAGQKEMLMPIAGKKQAKVSGRAEARGQAAEVGVNYRPLYRSASTRSENAGEG